MHMKKCAPENQHKIGCNAGICIVIVRPSIISRDNINDIYATQVITQLKHLLKLVNITCIVIHSLWDRHRYIHTMMPPTHVPALKFCSLSIQCNKSCQVEITKENQYIYYFSITCVSIQMHK